MSQSTNLKSELTAHARDLGESARAAATDAAEDTVSQATSTAAENLEALSDAADAAAAELPSGGQPTQALQQVADSIEDIARQIREADLQEITAQATRFTRENPMLVLGGAALVGFAAARFLKARGPQRSAAYSHSGHADDTVMSRLNESTAHD